MAVLPVGGRRGRAAGDDQQVMYGLGAIESAAGLIVLVAARIGGPLVAAWLATIVVNLGVLSALGAPVEPLGRSVYWDIALRDFGLMLGAIALSLFAVHYRGAPARGR